jgi:hypothetical protein
MYTQTPLKCNIGFKAEVAVNQNCFSFTQNISNTVLTDWFTTYKEENNWQYFSGLHCLVALYRHSGFLSSTLKTSH